MSEALPPPSSFVAATAARAPCGSALGGWARTVAAVGFFVHSRLTSLRSARAKRTACAAVRQRTTEVQTATGLVTSFVSVALEERRRRAAAEAALAQLDAVAGAAVIVAVDGDEALDRGQRMRRRERRLHARQVALHEDTRASGAGARSGKQGERKRG